jgi:hypothetical protein
VAADRELLYDRLASRNDLREREALAQFMAA